MKTEKKTNAESGIRRYRIAMILTAVVLALDLGAGGYMVKKSLDSRVSAENMPSAGDFDPSSMGDFDPSSMGDFDPSSMGDFDPSSTGDFDPSSMGAFDSSSRETTDSSAASENTGTLSMTEENLKGTLIKTVLPFAAAAVILLILEIIFGIKLRKYKKCKKEAAPANAAAPEKVDPVLLRMKKKKRRRAWTAVGVVLVVGLVVILQNMGSVSQQTAQSVAVDEKVIETSADTGTITKTLESSGVVAAVDETDVSLAGSIRVSEYLVSDGDTVEAGDPVAIADKNSVVAAIGSVQDMLTELDEEMMEAKDAAESQDVEAAVDGTVVKVYAGEDDSVVDVMYASGALMLISLDDLLAVQIENTGSYNVGDEMTVTSSDGTSETGHVAAIEKEKITVTVSLDDYTFGDSVTVTDAEGNSVGSGELYIYNQQKITGYSGTVESVAVSEGSSVDAGDTLLTLSDTDYTAKYQSLLQKRITLEDQYNELIEISRTGYVYAQESGTVSDLDEDLLVQTEEDKSSEQEGTEADTEKETSVQTDTESTDTSQISADNVSYIGGRTSGLMLLSTGTYGKSGQYSVSKMSSVKMVPLEAETVISEEAQSTDVSQTEQGGDTAGDTGDTGTEDPGNTGDTGTDPQEPEETVSKSVNVVWLNEKGSVTTENIPESAVVKLLQNGTVVSENAVTAQDNWITTWSNLQKYNTDGTEYTYSVEAEALEGYTVQYQTSGSVMLIIYTKNANDQDGNKTPETTPGASQDGQTGTNGMPSSNMTGDMSALAGAMSGMGGMSFDMSGMTVSTDGSFDLSSMGTDALAASAGTETTEEDTSYVMSETQLYTIIPDDEVSIEISIDELDIGNISVGQSCAVTFDAFSGTYDGVISERDPSGSNSGGDTKYAVKVVVDKTEEMLLGMNASVSITLDENEDVLLIPESALVEQNDSTYVYTEYDEKKDELAGLTEVTTGISDGENVEILEGLESGQNIYYRYADTINYSF